MVQNVHPKGAPGVLSKSPLVVISRNVTFSEIQYERRKNQASENVGKFHKYIKCRM